MDKVEQRAWELLEAECGKPLPFDVPVHAALSAIRAALAQQPAPSAPVEVEASYHPCTSILIEGLKRLEGGSDVLAEWDRARAKADTALAQQPAAVNEAMVERAWVAFCENNGSARQGIRAALTAALATQHQEPKS